MFRALLPLLALACATAIPAQDYEAIADKQLSKYDREDEPGVIVCAFQDGETLFAKAYGMANLTYGIPMDVETPSNIGSTSKQFTSFAIMLLVEEGKLTLEDEVRKHIPEIPEFSEKVTVRHILTHTSGYRDFLSFLSITGRRPDLGDAIERREVIDVAMGQTTLQNSPGAEWNYNNSGYALAAVIVERLSGQPFDEFMTDRVFGPLDMNQTMVRPTPQHLVPERSIGYEKQKDGSFFEKRDLGAAVGAGGIYASVLDLQKWVENFADPKIGSAEIFAEMMTPYVLTNGKPTTYGLGLMIDEQDGVRRIHHGGADIAHRSMLVYYPEINAGLTTQSNRADFDSSIAFELAAAFFAEDMKAVAGDTTTTEASSDVASLSPVAFDKFVGEYELEERKGFILTLSRDAQKFFIQATGQARLALKYTSDLKFDLQGVTASIELHPNENGEIDALTLNQGGEHRATRLVTSAKEVAAPEMDLAPYAGRYFSEELKSFYLLKVDKGRLVLVHRRREGDILTPGSRDSFTGAEGARLDFERDSEQKITGFIVSAGRTRGVRVERMK